MILVHLHRQNVSILRPQTGMTLLHHAVREGHTEVVDFILPELVHAINSFGQSALHIACYQGRKMLALKLLLAGCDPEAKDVSDSLVLKYAFA